MADNLPQLNSHMFPEVYKWLGVSLDTLGCVMLDLIPLRNMYDISIEGGEVSLYYSQNPQRKWINGWIADKQPHITLLYGLLQPAANFAPHIERVLADWRIDEVTIEDIGFFPSPYEDEPYFCIVAHIKKTPELLEGFHRLEFLPHVNTHAGYKPHMTICYIKNDIAVRDTLINQFKQLWVGQTLKVITLVNLGGNL